MDGLITERGRSDHEAVIRLLVVVHELDGRQDVGHRNHGFLDFSALVPVKEGRSLGFCTLFFRKLEYGISIGISLFEDAIELFIGLLQEVRLFCFCTCFFCFTHSNAPFDSSKMNCPSFSLGLSLV